MFIDASALTALLTEEDDARELLALLDQPRMKGITVIGTSGGGYFAARLALLRPKQVRPSLDGPQPLIVWRTPSPCPRKKSSMLRPQRVVGSA